MLAKYMQFELVDSVGKCGGLKRTIDIQALNRH